MGKLFTQQICSKTGYFFMKTADNFGPLGQKFYVCVCVCVFCYIATDRVNLIYLHKI